MIYYVEERRLIEVAPISFPRLVEGETPCQAMNQHNEVIITGRRVCRQNSLTDAIVRVQIVSIYICRLIGELSWWEWREMDSSFTASKVKWVV